MTAKKCATKFYLFLKKKETHWEKKCLYKISDNVRSDEKNHSNWFCGFRIICTLSDEETEFSLIVPQNLKIMYYFNDI